MKKMIFIFSFLFLSFFLMMDSFSQSFYTGAIGVTQNNAGRTRVYSDNLTTWQLDRVSLLVGVSSTAVFDYKEDSKVFVNASTITSPLSSDFEITSIINNSSSNRPPNVEAKFNIYGWNNEAYLLIKATIKNNETTAIDAIIGLEAIPAVNDTYEYDTLEWNSSAQTLLMYDNVASGIKFLSSSQKSLKLIYWSDPYANDSLILYLVNAKII